MILLHTQTYLKRGEIQAESSVIRLIYLRTFVHLDESDGSAIAAARGAARCLPAGGVSNHAQHRHQRRDLDQVRASLRLQRPDRGDPLSDRRHRERPGSARDAQSRRPRDVGRRAGKGDQRPAHDRRRRDYCVQGAAAAGQGVDARGSRSAVAASSCPGSAARWFVSDTKLGVPTPIHGFITTVLKPYVNGRS